MSVYRCWGKDHEDLTEKVQRARQAMPIFEMKHHNFHAKPMKRPKWRVKVRCSKGHENVFEGDE